MMTTKTNLFLMCGLLLGASVGGCTAQTEPGGDGQGTGTGTSSTQPPAAAASDYEISCHGEITKQSLGLDLSLAPRCVGGDGTTFGSNCGGDPCAAQDIAISYVPPATRCGSIDLFAWDGTTCKKYTTNHGGAMHCKGQDCEKLFKTEAECKAAYDACIAK